MNKIFRWIHNNGHLQGMVWTIFACFFSCLYCILVKVVDSSLPVMQIMFVRLLIVTIMILPVFIKKKVFPNKNQRKNYFFRVLFGYGAMTCFIYGAVQTSLPSITAVSFIRPIYIVLLASVFLGEKSNWRNILSVVIGFCGVIIIAFFEGNRENVISGSVSLHTGVIFLIVSAFLFSVGEIFNKKMLFSESVFSILFYYCLGTTLIGFIPATVVWEPLNLKDMFFLLPISVTGVLVLFCLIKAAKSAKLTLIVQYRYIELPFSIFASYLFFDKTITRGVILGVSLISIASFFAIYCNTTGGVKNTACTK